MPREGPLIFWPRFVWETLGKHAILAGAIVRLALTALMSSKDTASRMYIDQVLMPVGDDEEKLDLFTMTTGGTAAVNHMKKIARLKSAGRSSDSRFQCKIPLHLNSTSAVCPLRRCSRYVLRSCIMARVEPATSECRIQ